MMLLGTLRGGCRKMPIKHLHVAWDSLVECRADGKSTWIHSCAIHKRELIKL